MEPIHKFEKAGLGKAPFKYVGYEYKTFQACHGAPVQVGGSCDYCGMGISNMFYIMSADGKRFKVGSNCVEKVGDAGLKMVVDQKVKELKAKARHEKDTQTLAWLNENLPTMEAQLKALPHPRGFGGKTMWDYFQWMMANSGAKGRGELAKALKVIKGGK